MLTGSVEPGRSSCSGDARVQDAVYFSPTGDNYLTDVDVFVISPASEGPELSVIDERHEQESDPEPDVPDDMNVVNRTASDAPATWPEEEREWLQQLEDDHGLLEIPMTNMGTVEIPLDDDEL